MEIDNIGIIVTSRVKSSRLPEKVLQEINGKTCFEILLDHLLVDNIPVVVAIPKNSDDDILEKIAIEKGCFIYRGDDDSPLHRLYNAAKEFGYNDIVRVTHDDILIDMTILRRQIQFHQNGARDYTFIKKIPDGMGAEVISVNALKRVIDKVGNTPVEYVSYYLKNKNFNVIEFYPPREYQYSFRLTMDYHDDLTLLRSVYALCSPPVGSLDIINLLKKNKYLLHINHLPKITFYTCVHDMSEYILDCVNSVVNQNYDDYEYIIIDDCSSDYPLNKICEYISSIGHENRKKFQFFRNTENRGLAESCNIAIKNARGKYVMRVDADDAVCDNIINEMMSVAETENCGAVISGFYNTDEELNVIDEESKNEYHNGCALINKSYLNELKYKSDLKYMEGKEFFDRLKKDHVISFIQKPLWFYRHHANSKTAQADHPENRGAK